MLNLDAIRERERKATKRWINSDEISDLHADISYLLAEIDRLNGIIERAKVEFAILRKICVAEEYENAVIAIDKWRGEAGK
jgi:hypothetical protein